MNILIADDHAVLRDGLKQILADDFTGAHFGEAATAAETLGLAAARKWDIILLDIKLPDRNGLEVLKELTRHYLDTPVLVLTSSPEDELAIPALRAGAKGYVDKQSAANELINAIRKLLAGGLYVSASLAELLAKETTRAPLHLPHESLSRREFEVFRLLVAGRCVKEIAAALSLSVKTVSTFRSRILAKLRLRNDVELAHYAHEHGLFPDMLPNPRAGT
jgi:DNA-binding NarL/FixJ family response regulator